MSKKATAKLIQFKWLQTPRLKRILRCVKCLSPLWKGDHFSRNEFTSLVYESLLNGDYPYRKQTARRLLSVPQFRREAHTFNKEWPPLEMYPFTVWASTNQNSILSTVQQRSYTSLSCSTQEMWKRWSGCKYALNDPGFCICITVDSRYLEV